MKPMRSMRERVSAAEWEVRVNLAACYRLVAKYGMTDLIYNHITARVPGPDHHILISGYGMLYEEVTASSLIKVGDRRSVRISLTEKGQAVHNIVQALYDKHARTIEPIGGISPSDFERQIAFPRRRRSQNHEHFRGLNHQ